MEFTATDHEHMARALRLAERGLATAHPNPRVGCVLVKDGAVIAEGWHERAGGPHAEAAALAAAGARARGATAYVTLEPCAHHGRTPPCADALVAAGVAEVVAAFEDPNPEVAGRGFAILERNGIRVRRGLLGAEAEALNAGFVKRMRSGRPWVRVKLGMSLDGRTALASGESRWITDAAARDDVQRLRSRCDAVITGIATVLADDPRLDVRLAPGPVAWRQPLRVVLDTHLRLPADARLLAGPGKALVLTAAVDAHRANELTEAHAEVKRIATGADGRLALHAVLDELGRRGINEALVEGGPTLAGAFVAARLVDELVFYIAPALLGDASRGAFTLPPLASLDERVELEITDLRAVGRDCRVTARVR